MSLEHLGHFVFRHRRAVLLAWLIIIIASAVAASMVSSVLSQGAYMPTSGEAVEGSQILEQELGIRPNVLIVVFTSETLRADDPQFMDEMDNALAGLHGIENLDLPITYRSSGNTQLISANGYTTYAIIGINGDSYTASELVPIVREGLRSQPNLTMLVTGQPALSTDSEAIAMDDMKRVEMYTFPLIAIVLLLVFGSLVAAGLPLAIGGASIVLTMGMVYLLGQYTDITTSCLTVVSFIGLGVGIDYSLLMVTRFREELRKGKVVEESLCTTIRTSGKAILFSAFTSVIGLSALISFDNPMIRSLGIGGVIVVLLALAAGRTLIPALLAALGPRVNRLTLFRLSQREGTFWQRLARWEMRHPAMVLLIIIPFLALLIMPLADLRLGYISYTVVPERAEARQGYEVLENEFCAGELAPIMVAVTAHSTILDEDKVEALYDLTREIAQNDEVSRIESIVNLDPSITKEQYQLMYAFPDSIPDPQIKDAVDQLTSESTTLISIYGESDPTGAKAMELVTYIRSLDPEGLDTYVTGPAAAVKDAIDGMYSHFPWVLLFIFAATYVSLFWLFKSVLLPLKAIILNAAGVAATFGVIVFIFQQGHFSGLLDFTAWGVIEASLPIIIFCIVFGLSMDYEVFLLARIKESWDKTHDNTTSVALGLARTGRVITSAALIMVVVFGSFLFTDLIYIKVIGLGLALAIFIDAAIIRVFMAPALMRVMGKWNWWAPAFMERLWAPRGAVGIPELAPGKAIEFALRMKGVSQSYRIGDGEVRALKNVTLDVARGEFIVIVGPDGSGKTTLLNLVGGIESPTSGSIKSNGIMITKLNHKGSTAYRRNTIGFISRCFNLVPTLTVRGNVEFAIALVKRPRNALKVLKLLGLQEYADHYPNKLSGSKQQRLAIAVALAKDPPILLCDEPTGELDFETGKRILSILRKINQRYKKTVIIATNNPLIEQIADRVIRLLDGEIIEDRRNYSPIEPRELRAESP